MRALTSTAATIAALGTVVALAGPAAAASHRIVGSGTNGDGNLRITATVKKQNGTARKVLDFKFSKLNYTCTDGSTGERTKNFGDFKLDDNQSVTAIKDSGNFNYLLNFDLNRRGTKGSGYVSANWTNGDGVSCSVDRGDDGGALRFSLNKKD